MYIYLFMNWLYKILVVRMTDIRIQFSYSSMHLWISIIYITFRVTICKVTFITNNVLCTGICPVKNFLTHRPLIRPISLIVVLIIFAECPSIWIVHSEMLMKILITATHDILYALVRFHSLQLIMLIFANVVFPFHL